MSTWLDVRQYEPARLIEINSYVKKDMGRAFGIGYNFGWDKHGHPTLSDWTYIPSIVVAEWRSKFEPDVTFYEILNTDVERMEECTEHRHTPFEQPSYPEVAAGDGLFRHAETLMGAIEGMPDETGRSRFEEDLQSELRHLLQGQSQR
ncbi:uncharacterized protein FFC1_13798 [Fusarium fujikuroi]|nr:uncharacterized protein FFC1_13798 [Fusarium fujikuroi]